MIAVDTNVLVRLIVGDDEVQGAKARHLIDACAEGNETCFVSNPVLCELEWVLETLYSASRAEVASAIQALASEPPFQVEDAEAVQRALAQYTNGKGDFSDYLLGEVGRSAGARTTYTFDRDLRKAAGFTLL